MTFMEKRYSSIIILFVVLALIGSGSFYWFLKIQPQKRREVFSQEYRAARLSNNAGRINEALVSYERALEAAPSQSSSIQIEMERATTLFLRNEGNDRIQAVEILRSIIVNHAVHPRQRAFAVTDLMYLFQPAQSDPVVRGAIFNGDPFGKFLNEARIVGYRDDVAYAARLAFEFAETLYPLSINELNIAQWYFGELEIETDQKKLQEVLSQVRYWTTRAEENFAEAQKIGYAKEKLALMAQINALARRYLAAFGGSKEDYARAENLFESALRTLDPEIGSVYSYDVGLFIRLRYAGMLAQVYGAKRLSDIQKLLEPITVGPPAQWRNHRFFFYEFMRNQVNPFYDPYGPKKDILRLIILVPEMRESLAQRGIVY